MNKSKPYILIRPNSKKQRQQFKNICRSQGVPVIRAIPLLMQKVIDGELTFERQERIIK